jgi:hypothetical protein
LPTEALLSIDQILPEAMKALNTVTITDQIATDNIINTHQIAQEESTSHTLAAATILTAAETKFICELRLLREIHPYSAQRVLDLDTYKVYLVRQGILNSCDPYAIQREHDGHTLGIFRTTMYVDGTEEQDPSHNLSYI